MIKQKQLQKLAIHLEMNCHIMIFMKGIGNSKAIPIINLVRKFLP